MTLYEIIMLLVAVIAAIVGIIALFLKSSDNISQTQKQTGAGRQSQSIFNKKG